MAFMLLGATTASAASFECAGMSQGDAAMQTEPAMAMPCHPSADDANELQCDDCNCLHMVPYAQHAMLMKLPENAVEPHAILWRSGNSQNPIEELFQPPI